MRAYIPSRGSVGSIIDMQSEHKMKSIKRAIGTVFLARNLLEYEPDIDLTIDKLIKTLERRGPTEKFNFYDVLQHFQLDFLLRVAFGEDAGCLAHGRDVLGLTGLAHQRLHHWYSWQPVPSLERFFFQNPLWSGRLVKKSRWVREGAARVEARRALINATTAGTKKKADGTAANGAGGFEKMPESEKGMVGEGRGEGPRDLLDKYFAASEKHPDAIPPQLILNLVNSTIAAGTDTTVGIVTVLFYFLLKHPDVKKKLMEELHSSGVLPSSGLEFPVVSYVSVKGLSYLDAVIKETLRLLSVLGTTLDRTVPPQGATLGSVHLPGGTVVGCSAYVMHRHEATFGPLDVNEFRPERWLLVDSAKRVAMEHATLSWSHGTRTCLGRNLAEIEMKKLVSSILLRFEVSLVIFVSSFFRHSDSPPVLFVSGNSSWEISFQKMGK